MDKSSLVDYLNELQEQLNDLNDDLLKTSTALRDAQLENELYQNVGSKIEESISSINTLISDVEGGVYDDPNFEDMDGNDD